MRVTYLLRLDDISWDMNHENFQQIRDLFFKYDIKPLIGVIPCNQDEKLKQQVGKLRITQEEFWVQILDLQQSYGWAIAQHGYNHVYETRNGGIFNINHRSEFAGLPLDEQIEKVRKGKSIMENRGLHIDAFMAPAHSLDWNTVEAVKRNGIFTITDGLCWYPYKKKGVLFMPQISPWPREKSRGIDTICLHINSWQPARFEMLEKFLRDNHFACGTFQEEVARTESGHYKHHGLINLWSNLLIRVKRFVRRLIQK